MHNYKINIVCSFIQYCCNIGVLLYIEFSEKYGQFLSSSSSDFIESECNNKYDMQ